MKRLAALALMTLPGQAMAQQAELLRFVTCPVYRDTDSGRKSGCWLADARDTGVRYDVTSGPTKPDWNYEILVEGRVARDQQANPCGGVVLDPVRVSILDTPCHRTMIPAEGFKGRKFGLPTRNVRPLSEARAAPPGPYGPRSFYLYFEFGRAFSIYQYDDYLIDNAVTWLRAARPKRIVVTGYAATDPDIVSGRMLRERPEVARERAEMAAESLRRLGLANLKVQWKTGAQPIDDPDADGIPAQSRRRVEIHAEF